MKYFLFLTLLLLIDRSYSSNSKFEFENTVRVSTEFKMKSRSFLQKLDSTVNFKDKYSPNPIKQTTGPHSSIPPDKKVSYLQYEYKEYPEIVEKLKDLALKYPNFVKLDTAQNLYKLPNPGGECTHDGQKCYHWIVTLTNHKIDSKNKPQIYFSGTVHGNERVGPTATLELILLLVENSNNPWIKHLLDTRLIVITPMTNPYGYVKNEELLIKNENSVVITSNNYSNFHKDINRDFPYLVNPSKCMESIGARLVNELYINHMFSLALSLHGGTESLTYPYGVPNHIMGNPNIIPMNYFRVKEKLFSKKTPLSDFMASRYRKGEFDGIIGKSTPPPDGIAFKRIAHTASDHTTTHKNFHYEIGDMSNTVYPVRGGMEDWAYSGSWEGDPIINKCSPKTYDSYPESKTDYSKNYPDALKSIMFLLEVSNDKNPDQMLLGRKNVNCLLNLRENAFFNKVKTNKQLCLDPLIDGYIPRVLRLSLTLIDLLEPYVNISIKRLSNNLSVDWTVGGAIGVDKTFILYDYVDNDIKFKKKFNEIKDNSKLRKIFTYRTKPKFGKAIWDEAFSTIDIFRENINLIKKKRKFLVFVVLAQVDKTWSSKHNIDPPINPQTHIVNLRTNKHYKAQNNGFILKGQKYFKSELKIIKIKDKQ